jgi:hypothetical protein
MADIEFIDGLNAKAPRQNAPDFVKASLSIKREALIAWLQQREGEWVNADIKESKSGKWYVAVDAWKPNSDGQSGRPQHQESKPAQRDPVPSDPGFLDEIPF